MTRTLEDMAREAGFDVGGKRPDGPQIFEPDRGAAVDEELERFAALVRAQALDEAAAEAEHWQRISRPEHKCGDYIAGAILALKGRP